MARSLTPEEIEKRFQQVFARDPEEITPEDTDSLKTAEGMDDSFAASLDELKRSLEGYSGEILLQIPRSLHKTLKQEADIEGVSLDQYMLFKLAK